MTRLIILANNAVEEYSATLAGASKPDENQQEENYAALQRALRD
jgi:hypothetical protein